MINACMHKLHTQLRTPLNRITFCTVFRAVQFSDKKKIALLRKKSFYVYFLVVIRLVYNSHNLSILSAAQFTCLNINYVSQFLAAVSCVKALRAGSCNFPTQRCEFPIEKNMDAQN